MKEPVFEGMDNRILSLMLNSEQYDKLKQIADQKKISSMTLVTERFGQLNHLSIWV
ncbi:hypothetical protein [Desulfonema magnum]|uniref:Uncharacterized protein n=1 Tax=Desulfonema magnum TaxID=45655 RepID=A0A975GQA1_9BACT|nr:hypothetical protein [Desulfonema magnum]QTA89669.1 Uncharacterized protein dnm_057260 [Desulfonema magnum]